MYSDGPGNKTHFSWKLTRHLNNAWKLYVVASHLPAVDERQPCGKNSSLLPVVLSIKLRTWEYCPTHRRVMFFICFLKAKICIAGCMHECCKHWCWRKDIPSCRSCWDIAAFYNTQTFSLVSMFRDLSWSLLLAFWQAVGWPLFFVLGQLFNQYLLHFLR